ncbi:Variable surface protein Vir7-like protein [Plasmodium coatneyi]|uniref:Variable surface protein Vir7-like protein n=1 Tax=Plasmodium coatneyi TaxID=208452 RepID=A0A1B1DYH8_9APIC|nr:Variable surface protein Vir7-like protein [Plasmodium coatneyi]ANQ07871.1 Variable surface protein Vir7-like protein [Plasmodium coatneyi]
MSESGRGPLTGSDWLNLPYGKIYSELEEAQDECNNHDANVQSVKGALSTKQGTDEHGRKIVKAYCEASQKKNAQQKSSEDMYCNVVYYWIGDTLYNVLDEGSNNFSDLMSRVYSILRGEYAENKCDIVYKDGIDKDLFGYRKKVYEFSQNYEEIQQQLRRHIQKCDENYFDNLKAAEEAFSAVLTDCNGKIDPYCMQFKNTFDVSNGQIPLTLSYNGSSKSKGESDQEVTVYNNVQLKLNFASKANPTATIVSSILGIAGLPTITFFLYKRQQRKE